MLTHLKCIENVLIIVGVKIEFNEREEEKMNFQYFNDLLWE